MDISLSPSNEKFIKEQIAAGIYNSINEAINETISIAISSISVTPDEIKNLKNDIADGVEDIKTGRIHDGLGFMDKMIETDE